MPGGATQKRLLVGSLNCTGLLWESTGPKEKEESDVKETPEVKLSLEEELRLITTKNGLTWDIGETLNIIKERDWGTPELGKQGYSRK